MSVQIQEVEVHPSPQGAQQPQQQPQQGQAAGGGAPSPELGQEIARTVALLHTRDLRLHAD
jgi:hypothetical protein